MNMKGEFDEHTFTIKNSEKLLDEYGEELKRFVGRDW